MLFLKRSVVKLKNVFKCHFSSFKKMTRMQVWKNSWNSECFDIKVLNQCAWNIAFPAFIYLTYLMEYE